MTFSPAVPDPPEVDPILWAGFHQTPVSFDVGANGGQTLPRIHAFSDVVVAFEPSLESFTYLSERFSGIDGILLTPLAVSSESGSVDLVAAPGKIDTGQLVTAGPEGMEWSAAAAKGEVRSVPCITLDHYAESTGLWPEFLKIDVEGHEEYVLKGADNILLTGPEMLIEIHSEKLGRSIQELLTETYGYRIEVVRHPHYDSSSLLYRSHFWLRCFPRN